MTGNRNDFRWALAVLVFSGAAALGHQLLWTRRMADLIGATGDSNARVLGCYFLGLALGAAVAAVIMPRVRRPWRTVGLIELGIALLSLPVFLVNFWSAPIWPALGPEKLLSWQGACLKSLLSVLVVLPPAFLAGMTFPVLTAAVCPGGKGVSRAGVWLYAAYTLGGALGVAVVAGVVLHRLGAAGSMLLMVGMNAVVGAVCFLRDRAQRLSAERAAQEPSPTPFAEGLLPQQFLMLLSFLSGTGVLALEVAGLQLLNLKAPLAFYTPAAILFCVVILLACSAALVAAATRFLSTPAPALIFCCALAGLATAIAPLSFLAVTAGSSGIGGHGAGLAASLLQLGAVTCLSLGPAVLVAGMVFPLLISSIGPANAHPPCRTLAQLLAMNGVGGLLGAEIAHRLLLPSLGVHLALGRIAPKVLLPGEGV